MTMSSHRHEPLFDIDPVTGASIEIFWADATLATFGRVGAGWWWHPRQRGFAPTGLAYGPFPTCYSAFRYAVNSGEPIVLFGRRSGVENRLKTRC
jgi:hypothetical protein